MNSPSFGSEEFNVSKIIYSTTTPNTGIAANNIPDNRIKTRIIKPIKDRPVSPAVTSCLAIRVFKTSGLKNRIAACAVAMAGIIYKIV